MAASYAFQRTGTGSISCLWRGIPVRSSELLGGIWIGKDLTVQEVLINYMIEAIKMLSF
jgi:hypothetical protein